MSETDVIEDVLPELIPKAVEQDNFRSTTQSGYFKLATIIKLLNDYMNGNIKQKRLTKALTHMGFQAKEIRDGNKKSRVWFK
ncbi:hypothetical protein PsalMR5_00776 [Piscirickettsia salmonis]|uniref:hypothetical protein n=1 Tax=Piscirickettsia salmonis TaxID=1238 RepID=UPI0012BAFEA9|nr:hypothetical protein [Piscirickettsia salmonis]QGP53368.1 hypothetical protein PsalSR1_00778 [Piscirickettsia salmonis]QGP60713.1 hypothetical protein PsalBI1_03332 [Piscirickettsia salmonis]QGP62933.1 hypothetical protein PsalMR5_00776 [Piscirickettsia salmonis]